MQEAEKIIKRGHEKAYFAFAITRLAQNGHHINIVHTHGLPWIEIDFEWELKEAEKILDHIDKRNITQGLTA